MLYLTAKFFFRCFYFPFWKNKALGKETILQSKKGAIIAPNHYSYFDPPLIAISSPRPVYFLAKRSLFANRFFNWIFRKFHSLPIEGGVSDKDSLKDAINILENKGFLVIFPEGTRSQNGKIAPFQKGVGMLAFRLRCPIIPTYIHGTYESWPPQQPLPTPFRNSAVVFGTPIPWKAEWNELSRKDCIRAVTEEVEKAVRSLQASYLKNLEKEEGL